MTYIVVCGYEIGFMLLPEKVYVETLYERDEVVVDLLQHFGSCLNALDELRAGVNYLGGPGYTFTLVTDRPKPCSYCATRLHTASTSSA